MEFTNKELSLLAVFQDVTKTSASYIDYTPLGVVFLVSPFVLGKAIGRGARNVKALKKRLGSDVLILPDFKDEVLLLRHAFKDVNVLAIERINLPSQRAVVLMVDEQHRGIVIGKDGRRIRTFKQLLKNRFNVQLVLKTKKVLEG